MAVVLLALVALLYVCFASNNECLFVGLDGATWVNLLKVQAEIRAPFTQTGVDPLAGSFDAYHPTFREYLLPTALGMLVGQPVVGKVVTYTVYAAALILSSYLAGRAVGFSRLQSLLGGAALPFLALPAVAGRRFLFPLLSLNPHISQIMALSLLIVAALWALEGRSLPVKIALASVPAMCVVLATLGLAASAILMAPAVLLYGGASLFSAPSWRNFTPRILSGIAAIVVMLALGFAQFYYALFEYTAYHFFAADFQNVRSDLMFVSTYFWTEPVGRWLIILGCVGALWSILEFDGKRRTFAYAHLAATTAYFGAALSLYYFAQGYSGPSPVYFETCLWPYSVLFSAVLLTRLAAVPRLIGHWTQREAPPWLEHSGGLIVAGGVAGLLLVATFRQAAPLANCPHSFAETKPTAITEHLRQSIGLGAGQPFRGIAATITGAQVASSVEWHRLHAYDGALSAAIGNDHRIVGLWDYRIPTLFQYFSFISPAYYLVVTSFLARPEDHQIRSVLVLTRINQAMMRLWGVRFVITDLSDAPGREVASVPVPGQQPLRLIEFADPNLGQYSPTEIVQANDFRAGLAAMRAAQFDGRTKVITDAALKGPFAAAANVELIYERDGFRLRATAPGRSLLVLPVQFSRCWTIEALGEARLFRANLMQLGVAFSGPLDAKLVFRFGPIWASGCRVDDFNDMQRLRVSEAK